MRQIAVKLLRGLFVILLLNSPWGQASEIVHMHLAVSERHAQGLARPGEYRLSWQLLERALANDKGFEITPSSLAWSWAQTQLQQGKLDAVFFAAKTTERAKWAQFSPPLTLSRAGFFSLPGTKAQSLSELKASNELIGVLQGTAQNQFLLDKGFTNIYPLVESDALLQMLLGGRIKHAFIIETLANYYCTQMNQEQHQPCLQSGEVPQENTIHIMGNLGDPAFLHFSTALTEGLKHLVATNQVLPLYKENNLSSDSYETWLAQLNAYATDLKSHLIRELN
ncbi:transporter substrate-binding domain-containing protein [Bowmanella sp. Y26]|uniref:substrate-binding periplasmic protein n=1 Tax=Bowmanella yangjiangensis TaxID=2811230 RepID=UPI001BDD211A|nr:transporter substrate-binding domain-containing protein [Bowmanella yangjiangensis]MBT1064957.1 transporter substrate-binding domain-containing protein [Bowmanella yangjiangensis]